MQISILNLQLYSLSMQKAPHYLKLLPSSYALTRYIEFAVILGVPHPLPNSFNCAFFKFFCHHICRPIFIGANFQNNYFHKPPFSLVLIDFFYNCVLPHKETTLFLRPFLVRKHNPWLRRNLICALIFI